jgi:hypothetical protein
MLATADTHESTPTPSIEPGQNPTGLLVLGMHRSGTSALSAVLGILGAELGTRLLGPAPDNPKGYFEDGITVGINQYILDTFFARGIWPMKTEWHKARNLRGVRPRIDATLDYFHEHPLFLIKDPRLCLTLPVWLERGGEHGIDFKLVYTARNPLNVIRSLVARDNIKPDIAATSWFLHTAIALTHGRDYPKTFVSYESLMSETEATLARLSEFDDRLEMTDDRRQAVDDFLDAGLQHHREPPEPPADPVRALSVRLYEAIASGDETEVYSCLDSEPVQSLLAGLLISGAALGKRHKAESTTH